MSSRTIALDLICNGTVTTSGQIINRNAISATTYSVTTNDHLIACDSASNAITITLPAAAGAAGQVFVVVDEGGSSATNAITINVDGGGTIHGDTSLIINTNRSSVSVYSSGAAYHIF